MQREVTQTFNQNAQKAGVWVGTKAQTALDDAKQAEANGDNALAAAKYKEAEQWKNNGLILDSVVGVLSGPNSGGLMGSLANAGKPWVAAEIGKHFKEQGTEGTPAHILAHTIVGAAVAGATGNNALAGGLSAGGGEALAPIVKDFLYGQNTKVDDLTPEQKQTISNIISLGGAGVGAAVGGSGSDAVSGGQLAGNAVDNNFDLVRVLSPASAAELSRDLSHKKTMQQLHELRKINSVVVIVAETPYIIALGGAALVPLSGSGATLALSETSMAAILKAAGTGAVVGGGVNAVTQYAGCTASSGQDCISQVDGNKVVISASVGGVVGPIGLAASGAAGVGQVGTGSIIKNTPALMQFFKNNPSGSVIWLNQTAVGATSNKASQGIYDYFKKKEKKEKK